MRKLLIALCVSVFVGPSAKVQAAILFGPAESLGPTVNASVGAHPSISSNGLSLFFHANIVPGGVNDFDLWMSTRSSLTDPWGAGVNLGPTVNRTDGNEIGPDISGDGLTLVFSSNRPGSLGTTLNSMHDIWMSTRSSESDPWGTPVNQSALNSLYIDAGPSISSDGLTVLFDSTRPGGAAGFDLWMSTRLSGSDPWDTPTLVTEVNSIYTETSPSMSADGLTLFFGSTRPGGFGGWDLWMSTRGSQSDAWGTPVNLGDNVNTSAHEGAPDAYMSPDVLSVYYNIFSPPDFGELWVTHSVIPEPSTFAVWGLLGLIGVVLYRLRIEGNNMSLQ